MKTNLLPLISMLSLAAACAPAHHAVRPSPLGAATTEAKMLAVVDAPGPLTVETINSCDWAVDRDGLINLDHPRAKEAGLEKGDEPIQVYFHVIRHPTRGTYIVDSGVESALRDAPEKAAIQGLVASVLHPEKMVFHVTLGDWLKQQKEPLAGVMLTHLHGDHSSGLPDVGKATPVYEGPGELDSRNLTNFFVAGMLDKQLEGLGPLNEWTFDAEGVVDVFGDGSLFAIWVPGHTPGSTAYLARTANGPVLITGDASHTAWGWEHDVEPGSFSYDQPKSAASLARLRKLVAEHPSIDVRLGHQVLPAQGRASAGK